ncbi:MAG: LamG-like jellyroll fold domain-containing protein [Pirellulaceae bacterium]
MKRSLVFSCVLFMALGNAVRADLVGYWPLDGDANDASGNGNHGEIVGDTAFADDTAGGLGGQAILLNKTFVEEFGGVSQDEIIAEGNAGYVDLGNPDILNFSDNDWTVAAWMRVPEFLTQRGNIFSNGGDNGGGVRYVLGYLENGGQAIVLTTDDDTDKRQAQAPLGDFLIDDGEWHHVVGQREGTELRVYIDGEFAAENLDVPDGYDLSGTSQLPAYIGVGADAASGDLEKFFQGWIDEVAVWNEALTEDDILTVMSGDLSKWLTNTGVLGDFDGNGVLDVADINALTVESAAGTNNASFDITNDSLVNTADVTNWIKDLKNSWIGDANVDGEFNSGDFVQVFTAGKFEQDVVANWQDGDWNGDGRFNSGDFVAAFTDGGFELGPRGAVSAVPEPSTMSLVLIGLLGLARIRRK